MAGGRVGYWLNRLRHLGVRNMLDKAAQISHDFHRNRAVIVLDMMWCAARYNAGYYDYHEFEYHLLNHRQRMTMLTRPEANHLTKALNPAEFRHLFADKSEFNRRFAPYIGRDWLDLRDADADALERFAGTHPRFMAKASDALAGAGVDLVEAASVRDWARFREELLGKGQFLVEELIVQHPEMARLHPPSVNTLRVITFFDGTDVHLLAHVVKAGNGQPVDNFGRAGMYTAIYEGGRTRFAAFDKFGHIFPIHPVSGVDWSDFQIPLWDEVLATVDAAARVVPEIPYIGWDVAITPERPVLVEGNYNTGVFQMKPSITGVKEGLVPRYKAIIGDRWPR